MKYLFSVLSLILICSCSNNYKESANSIGHYEDELIMAKDMVVEASESESKNINEPQPNMLIKTGDLSFEVDELKPSKDEIDLLVSKYGSYYENERYSESDHRSSVDLSIRIPNKHFDAFIKDMEDRVGKMTSKNIHSRDVGEEYKDLNIRLKNNMAYLSQYKEILKKANTIEEILQVQEKIRRIEEEIESKKGRIQYLENKVNFSTLHVQVSELKVSSYATGKGFGKRVVNAFNAGFDAFLNFFVGAVYVWPFWLFIAVLYLFRKRLFSFFRSKF